MDDEYDDAPLEGIGEPGWTPPRDSKIDEAKVVLMEELFNRRPGEVFYTTQIEIMFERRFFHWITGKALTELKDEAKVGSRLEWISPKFSVRFFWPKAHRYWRRQVRDKAALIGQIASEKMAKAIGNHGEMMFDAALSERGFVVRARNFREWDGKIWTATKNTLDRVYQRDGVSWGTEIKNTAQYIAVEELGTKIQMCRFLGLRPLFIMRNAPKHYMNQIYRAGGFGLLFDKQLYPFGMDELAGRVRLELGLPTDCPVSVPDGHTRRFEKFHERGLRMRESGVQFTEKDG